MIKIKHKCISNTKVFQNLLSRVDELGTNILFRYDSTLIPGSLLFIPCRCGGKCQGRRRKENSKSRLDMTDFAVFRFEITNQPDVFYMCNEGVASVGLLSSVCSTF